MLNSTLIATERAMCCVIENYQTPIGIRVPDVLQEYMGAPPPPPPPHTPTRLLLPPPPSQGRPELSPSRSVHAGARSPCSGGVDFIPFVSPPPPPPKLKKGEKPPPPPAQHVPTKEEVAKAVAEARGPRVALQQCDAARADAAGRSGDSGSAGSPLL